MIYDGLNVEVIDSEEQKSQAGSYKNKPFIRLANPDGTLEITFNQFGMLFGVVSGTAKRLVREGKLPRDNVPEEWLR